MLHDARKRTSKKAFTGTRQYQYQMRILSWVGQAMVLIAWIQLLNIKMMTGHILGHSFILDNSIQQFSMVEK